MTPEKYPFGGVLNIWEGQTVPLPSAAQKEGCIQAILASGLPRPQRLREALPRLWRAVGGRGLFFGVEDCLFLGLLTDGLVWAGLYPCLAQRPGLACGVLFFASPFFYLLLHLLTLWKEMGAGVYEWKMVCRCSMRQLTALRMLAFGGVSLFLSAGLGLALRGAAGAGVSLLRMLAVAFSALFLFALLDLWAQRRGRNPAASLLAPAVWVGLGAGLLALGERGARFLAALPTLLFVLMALALAAVYFRALKNYYFTPKEGALGYAVG